jgi:putative heme utilization radical SAM enzyme HutW
MNLDLAPYFAAEEGIPFRDRWATMPWRNQKPVAPESVDQHWQSILNSRVSGNKRLLYLHIPFCATHCKFCGFYQNKLEAEATEEYCDYLVREIEMEASSPLHQSSPIHAVYFGGGTPTALSAVQLHRIISALKRLLPLAPDCEITVEGRILNFDDERVDACLEAGANRFSIGIQTFNTRIRQRMGRRATREEAVSFMRQLAERDRAAVVCDLMFGLPDQTMQDWQTDLDIVSDLPLDGVDLYALNLLPSTPLGKAVENKRVTLPDVTQRRDFYLTGEAFLADEGWRQLSNSHWARTTRERNLYNLLIKQGADCLAFGSCAGGNLNGQSYMMERSLERYYQKLDEGRKPIMMMTSRSDQYRWRLTLQGGIEVGYFDLARVLANPAPLEPLLQQWQTCGLMTVNGSRFRLTPAGRFWASNIMQALQTLVPQLLETQLTQPIQLEQTP